MDLLNLYSKTVSNNNESDLLKNHLYKNRNIFSKRITSNEIERIMEYILDESMEVYEWDYKVNIKDLENKEKMTEFNAFGNLSWNEFSHEIKTGNRYFVDNVDFSKLDIYIETLIIQYDECNKFYRSRIQKGKEVIGIKEMGAPPSAKAVSGRINPEGISNLYLSDDIKTSIYEVRPKFLDIVQVAEFVPKQSLKFIDLTLINTISPFSFGSTSEIYLDYYVNMDHLKSFESDLLRPVKRNDVSLEYIPTQYICEYIKKLGYDGVKYKSVINNNNNNIVAFEVVSRSLCKLLLILISFQTFHIIQLEPYQSLYVFAYQIFDYNLYSYYKQTGQVNLHLGTALFA